MATPDKVITLYKGKITLEFYEPKHLYIVRETGKTPISVTAVTGVIDKPALKFWAVNLARDYLLNLVQKGKPITEQTIIDASKLHQQQTKKAATIGSMVHDWCEAYSKGEKPELPTDKKVLNGVTAFLKWVDEHEVKFISAEQPVYSRKHDYCGIMDCEFTMGSEKHKLLHVGDYKTSSGVYPEMMFQVSAYQGAREEEADVEYGSKWLIRLGKEDGEFDPHESHDHKKDYKAFLGLLDAKRRLNEIKEGVKG